MSDTIKLGNAFYFKNNIYNESSIDYKLNPVYTITNTTHVQTIQNVGERIWAGTTAFYPSVYNDLYTNSEYLGKILYSTNNGLFWTEYIQNSATNMINGYPALLTQAYCFLPFSNDTLYIGGAYYNSNNERGFAILKLYGDNFESQSFLCSKQISADATEIVTSIVFPGYNPNHLYFSTSNGYLYHVYIPTGNYITVDEFSSITNNISGIYGITKIDSKNFLYYGANGCVIEYNVQNKVLSNVYTNLYNQSEILCGHNAGGILYIGTQPDGLLLYKDTRTPWNPYWSSVQLPTQQWGVFGTAWVQSLPADDNLYIGTGGNYTNNTDLSGGILLTRFKSRTNRSSIDSDYRIINYGQQESYIPINSFTTISIINGQIFAGGRINQSGYKDDNYIFKNTLPIRSSVDYYINDDYIGSKIIADYLTPTTLTTNITSSHYIDNTITPVTIQLNSPNISNNSLKHIDNNGIETYYPNATGTLSLSTGDLYKTHILMVNEPYKIYTDITTNKTKIGVPNNIFSLDISLAYYDWIGTTVYQIDDNKQKIYHYKIATDAWSYGWIDSLSPSFSCSTFKLDNNEDSYFEVLKYKPTQIKIDAYIDSKLIFDDTVYNDWYKDYTLSSQTTTCYVTTYPLVPVIYTPNKYIITGENIQFENLIQKFDDITSIKWIDRGNTFVDSNSSTTIYYNTSYDISDVYSLDIYTIVDTVSYSNTFTDIIHVVDEFYLYDPLILRYYGITNLSLPYSKEQCYIGPNDWFIADTFNSIFDRLEVNMNYLKKVSKVYDVPPTEYIGWLGALSAYDWSFRWHVNISGIEDGFLDNISAVDYKFSNLKQCITKDNIMYVLGETFFQVLSSDFFATEITEKRIYKNFGDDFGKLVSLGIDKNNNTKIYVLDTYKNEVMVFIFESVTKKWTLLYSWGKLGGVDSKNGLRNPNDLFTKPPWEPGRRYGAPSLGTRRPVGRGSYSPEIGGYTLNRPLPLVCLPLRTDRRGRAATSPPAHGDPPSTPALGT